MSFSFGSNHRVSGFPTTRQVRNAYLTIGATLGLAVFSPLFFIDRKPGSSVEKVCPPAEEQRDLPANNIPYLEVTLSNDNTIRADYRGKEDEAVRFSHIMGGQYQPTIEYVIEVSGAEATGTITRRSLEHETYNSNTQLYRQENGCREARE